jgi:hypothetical protein
MKKLIITVCALGLGMYAVAAQAGPADKPDSQSLSQGAKDANPGVTGGGSTSNPTAEPKSGTISDTAKENTDGGTNAATNPTGKPASSDLGSKKTNN